MSDPVRTALEQAQMDVRRLKLELGALPPMSEERRAAKALHETLTGEVVVVRRDQETERLHEIELRDQLGTPWWRSPFAPWAAGLAVIPGFVLALKLVDAFNWAYWSQHLALPVLAVPVVVNLARWGRARYRRRN